ncbi:kelch-like protein 12 [Arctopsyche grandis]|uniref:kelch-like protein 12 n=1 Tax=Arctopsyche grandis TaxID=121162 RepID=UPI00406D66DF
MCEFNGEVINRHFKKILMTMFGICNEESVLCDVDLVVGKNRFPVHKLILITNSDFFKSRINDTNAEIILEDSDEILAESVKKAIKFFYLGKIDLQLHLAVNIIRFSKMIEARELEEYCLAYIERIIDEKNFVFIEDFAKQHEYFRLLTQTKVYMKTNYLKIIQEDEFLDMSYELLSELLQWDDLNVTREEEAFQGLKNWVHKNYEFRKNHLDTLLKYIRLPLLPVQFIFNEVKPLCCDSLRCCQMLLDTMEYHQNPEKISSLNANPRKWCKHTILFLGGFFYRIAGKIEIYNPTDDKWSTYHDLNNDLCKYGAVVLNNILIIIGGQSKIDSKTTNEVSCFDFRTKEISELQPMHQKRRYFAATVIDDQIFVIGGRNDKNEVINSVERYDLVTNTWTKMADMLTPRYSHEIAVIGGEIYAIGGSNGEVIFKTMEIYNTQQNEWTAAPEMTEKRADLATVAIREYIYAIGGHNGPAYLKSVERFNTNSKTWTPSASLPERDWGHKAIVFGEKIFYIGGARTKSVLEYDPATDKWTDLTSISKGRRIYNLLLAPRNLLNCE